MLTDQRALCLIENMRRNTQSAEVAALCDWVLALVRRRKEEAAVAPAATGAASKADRKAYMKAFMRKRREREKEMAGSK